jgi:AmmeMemoRadiSam system protein B
VAALLYTAKELGAENAHILRYSHSGHVTGDLTSVVGYGSAAAVLP